MMMNKKLTIIFSAVLLGACAVTKVEPPAPVAAPASFKETGIWRQGAASTATQAAPDAWWTLFNDPVLNELQDKLVIGNENLKSAVAQVRAARAAVEASREALFPTLSVSGAGTRSASPSGTTNGNVVSSSGRPQNSYSLSANASWELDLWGRLSLATTGARASLQASVDDLAAARLSAQALLAQTYFSMRAAEAQAALYARTVAAYQRSLDLTQVRYQGGVAALSDVLQAQTTLKQAQAQELEAASTRAQMEHAIAVLLGIPPSELTVTSTEALPVVPAVPELLPATLLQRRPDIAAAQQRVAAAYAQIGIADAAWFPDLTLSASAGYRSSRLSNLVSAPNLFWSLGPALTEAIFDGGQRKLASAQARASADQATATYRQAVLTALQEVEDNLSVTDQTQRAAQLQQEALQAAQRNLEIVTDQYKAGTVSYLNVTTAQAAVLSSETSLLSLRNQQLAAVNTLLKNIAGRWEKA